MFAKLQRRCIICRERKIEKTQEKTGTTNYAKSKLFAEFTLIRLVCKQFALSFDVIDRLNSKRRHGAESTGMFTPTWVSVCVCV